MLFVEADVLRGFTSEIVTVYKLERLIIRVGYRRETHKREQVKEYRANIGHNLKKVGAENL